MHQIEVRRRNLKNTAFITGCQTAPRRVLDVYINFGIFTLSAKSPLIMHRTAEKKNTNFGGVKLSWPGAES
jgi:hypothetical protein